MVVPTITYTILVTVILSIILYVLKHPLVGTTYLQAT